MQWAILLPQLSGEVRCDRFNVLLVLTVSLGEIKGLGAYATYTLADEKISFKVPDTISSPSAATVPLAACTAWLALYSDRCLNIGRASKESVLIWGGSSSVAQFAIQLASIYGLNVVTTCSPRNFDLVKSLGAKHVYDYKSPNVTELIRKDVPDLKYVFDTIGNEDNSSGLAAESGNPDCTLCTVRPGLVNTEGVPETVKRVDVMIWTAFLKVVQYKGHEWPKSQRDRELGAELFENIPKWIAEGKFKPNAVHHMTGLKSVPEGFQLHRDGKISAKKVVYQI
ncbi:unnamed protein product [Penicillium olsonii]|nr:unnamed protein product [Penicillium olsonii]CAG7925374.1 unnamed protein product [Penicillium olsonii]